METEQQKAITAMWEQLVNSMPTDHMCDKLVQDGLLAVTELDHIDEMPTTRQKNRYILKAIIRCPSKNTFDIFMNALRSIDSVANELAVILDDMYRNLLPNNKLQQVVKTRSVSKEDDWNENDWTECSLYLAKNLGNNWKTLGRRLGLSEPVLSDCESNNPGRIVEARTAMLTAWRNSWSDAESSLKKKKLMEALAKCELNLYAHKIAKKEW